MKQQKLISERYKAAKLLPLIILAVMSACANLPDAQKLPPPTCPAPPQTPAMPAPLAQDNSAPVQGYLQQVQAWRQAAQSWLGQAASLLESLARK